MKAKLKDKEKAILLRKQGLSYKEILEKVFVAKSSLSLWLREVGLSKKQKQRLSQKKLESALRGAKARKDERIERTKTIKNLARSQIGDISDRELWLLGIMLYWAEGSKEKEYRVGQKVDLTNMDPWVLKIFRKWLKVCCGVSYNDLIYSVYIHENTIHTVDQIKNYWRKELGLNKNNHINIYYKKHKIKTNRKNIGIKYYGSSRITVKRSYDLNRKITGWIEGICGSMDF